jgi:hypothetical protein
MKSMRSEKATTATVRSVRSNPAAPSARASSTAAAHEREGDVEEHGERARGGEEERQARPGP